MNECRWCGKPVYNPNNKSYCQRRCASMDYVAQYAYAHEIEQLRAVFARREAEGRVYVAKWAKTGE